MNLPDGYRLDKTCDACPEQYDLLDTNGECVAYFRLRWGCFTVSLFEPSGPLVYEAHFSDDYKGAFDGSRERDYYLSKGVQAVLDALGDSV